MTALNAKLAFATVTLILIVGVAACTNRSAIQTFPSQMDQQLLPDQIQSVADLQYQGQASSTYAMASYGGRLYITATQAGFYAVDISATPENPPLVEDILTRGINLFSPIGSWVVGYYGSKSIAFSGSYAITSGSAGASVIQIEGSNSPTEVARYPMPSANGQVTEDQSFEWNAAVGHPQLPLIYAFQRDYIYVVDASQLPRLNLVSKIAYSPNGPVCCAERATIFQNKLLLAMRSQLWSFPLGPNGELGNPVANTQLQAVDVFSTNQLLYVHHVQNYNGGNSILSTGIYLYDPNGNPVRYLPYDPQGPMAVSPDDRDIFAPNSGNTAIDINRIIWSN